MRVPMGETRSPKAINWTQKVAVDLKSWLRVPMREMAKLQLFVPAVDHFDVFLSYLGDFLLHLAQNLQLLEQNRVPKCGL